MESGMTRKNETMADGAPIYQVSVFVAMLRSRKEVMYADVIFSEERS